MFINFVISNFNSAVSIAQERLQEFIPDFWSGYQGSSLLCKDLPNLTSTTGLSMKLNSFNVFFRRIIVPSLGQSHFSTSLDLISTSSSIGSLLYWSFLSCSVFSTVFSTLLTRPSSIPLLSLTHSCHKILMPKMSDIIHTFKDLSVIIRKHEIDVFYVS